MLKRFENIYVVQLIFHTLRDAKKDNQMDNKPNTFFFYNINGSVY